MTFKGSNNSHVLITYVHYASCFTCIHPFNSHILKEKKLSFGEIHLFEAINLASQQS